MKIKSYSLVTERVLKKGPTCGPVGGGGALGAASRRRHFGVVMLMYTPRPRFGTVITRIGTRPCQPISINVEHGPGKASLCVRGSLPAKCITTGLIFYTAISVPGVTEKEQNDHLHIEGRNGLLLKKRR